MRSCLEPECELTDVALVAVLSSQLSSSDTFPLGLQECGVRVELCKRNSSGRCLLVPLGQPEPSFSDSVLSVVLSRAGKQVAGVTADRVVTRMASPHVSGKGPFTDL